MTIRIKLTPDEHRTVRLAAALRGQPMSILAKQVLLEVADRINAGQDDNATKPREGETR